MNDTSFLSGIIGMIGGFFIVIIIFAVLQIIGNWKMYEKAGRPGWHSIIPYLNIYDLFTMAGFSNTWSIIGAVGSVVALVFTISGIAGGSDLMSGLGGFLCVICWGITGIMQLMTCFMLPSRFGKSAGAGFLFLFLPAIAVMVAGFSDSWVYTAKETENAVQLK